MSELTITTVDGGYEINVTSTALAIGADTISGYGPKGDPGAPGKDGIDGKDGVDGTVVTGIADVPGLQTALDSKAALIHYHIVNDITDFDGTVLAGGTF